MEMPWENININPINKYIYSFADAEDESYWLSDGYQPNGTNMVEFYSAIFKALIFNTFDLV